MTTAPTSARTQPVRQSPGESPHLSDYLRMLHKRRWTAGAVILLVFLTGATRSMRTTPVYEATAEVLIDQQARQQTSLDTVTEEREFSSNYEEFLPTELRILQSRALARRTLEALDLLSASPVAPAGDAGGFGVSEALDRVVSGAVSAMTRAVGAPQKIEPPAPDETTAQAAQIGAFLGGLTVDPVRDTRVVILTYSSPDPEFAARAVNTLAEQYAQQSIESVFTASKAANDWLSQQLKEQRSRVESSEASLQRFREAHGVVAADDRQNIVVQKLADLSAVVTRAKTERIDKEAAYNRLNSLRNDPNGLDAYPAVLGNSFIQQIKTEIADLQRQHATLGSRYGERHPEMVRATAQLRSAEAKLQIEVGKVVDSVRNDFLTTQARERSLVQALEAQKSEALSLNRSGIEYSVLERETVSNRELYENLLQRTKEAGVSGDFKGSTIRILDRAEVPRKPVLPRTSRDLLLALLGGCFAAVGLVFLLERLDSRIKSPDEIRTHLGLPCLGLVPVAPSKGATPVSPLLSNTVPPLFAEALRTLRTAVVFSSHDRGTRTVVVTSTGPHEGKTLVASNLAVALAQAGQRTLLIDGDLRRPRVHEMFAIEQEPGLSNVLVADSTLAIALRTTPVEGLSVLTAGHLPPNPAELLGSQPYGALLAELKQHFDWIIVDAPPVMAVTDAVVLAHDAGGVIFVVGAEMTPRRNAVAAIEQLSAAKARFIGVVLNRVELERHSYYYSPYYSKSYAQYYRAKSHS